MTTRAGYAALLGKPNVGKSTLLNRLLAQKLAITSHKPQTTRHRILGIKTTDTGQIAYVDTPGIHKRGVKAMNRYLNRTALTVLADVDVGIFVVQALQWTEEDDAAHKAIESAGLAVVVAVNKVDLVAPRNKLLPFIGTLRSRGYHDIAPVSAQTGKNCGVLEKLVLERLPASDLVFPEDQLSDRSERFFAAEFIREQIVRRYNEEIPYAVTVVVERFEESDRGVRIGAVIWVEREGQKGIIVGRGGKSLKAVATAARKALKRFYGIPVHLDVWVKVKKSWSSDERSLIQLGYSE